MSRSFESVYESIVVCSLNAYFREICDFAVHVLRSVFDLAVNEEFKTFLSVHHVLHAFYKAVSCNVFDNVALIVNPFNALTDVECVCETVFGNFIRLSKCGSLNVFNVVLKKSVVSVYDSFGVSSLAMLQVRPMS